MAYWLLKSEPDTFSIDDLIKAPHQCTLWEGVRNYQARNYLKNEMAVGDLAFFYHSSCATPGIVGLVKIISSAIPDPTQFDSHSQYYDPKSSPAHPRWYVRQVQFVEKLSDSLTLMEIKTIKELKNFRLIQKGNRLSVFPVSSQEWQIILKKIHDKK